MKEPRSFPPLDNVEAVHQWLCAVFGSHPDELLITDPIQGFALVVDLEPLMQILGGPWLRAIARCHEAKASMKDRRPHIAGEDGSFMGKLKLAPREGAKVFDRASSIGTDLAAAANQREIETETDIEIVEPIIDPHHPA